MKVLQNLPILFLILACSCTNLKESDLIEEFDCTQADLILEVDSISKPNCTEMGTISVIAMAGQSPYVYRLESASNSTGIFDGLPAGDYSISVEDANGCTQAINVMLNPDEGSIVATANVTDALCDAQNGEIEVQVAGGTEDYMFSINGDEPTSSQVFTGLSSGTYEIVISDGAGCSATITPEVGFSTGDFTAALQSGQVSGCGTSNGSISIAASGGSGNYTFSLNGGAVGSSGTFNGLQAGSYSVEVADDQGCSVTVSETVLSGVSLASDIMPIINSTCAGSSCHESGNSARVTLVANGAGVIANASSIKSRTQSGNMPRGGSLTQAQKDLIACWVDDNAPDN